MAASGAQRRAWCGNNRLGLTNPESMAWRAQVYDLVAGGQGLTISRYMSPTESRRQFPTLAELGPNANKLKGTVRSAGPAPSRSLPATT